MNLKFTFIILCICATCIVLLIALRSYPGNLKTYFRRTDLPVKKSVLSTAKLLIEPRCGSYFVVWIVTSSADNILGRTALRRAFSIEELKELNVRRVFLLGVPTESKRKHVLQESQKHKDILQGDFIEAYRNLTVKHLMGLKWASQNCATQFLIKTDDDIVVDLFKVLALLRNGTVQENAISGYALRNMTVVRTPGNKWFVTKEEFPEDIYPDFLSGWFYITSVRVAEQLVTRSNDTSFFWIDDVYITGVLRKDCGIKIGQLNDFYATDYRYLECCIRGKRKRLRCEFIAGPDGGKKELQMEFKEFSAFCKSDCSDRTKEDSVARTCVSTYETELKAEDSRAQIHSIGRL